MFMKKILCDLFNFLICFLFFHVFNLFLILYYCIFMQLANLNFEWQTLIMILVDK